MYKVIKKPNACTIFKSKPENKYNLILNIKFITKKLDLTLCHRSIY